MTRNEWESAVAKCMIKEIVRGGFSETQAQNMATMAVLIGTRGRSHTKTTPETMARALLKKARGR